MTDKMFMAYDADTETWSTPYSIIFVEVSEEEIQEIYKDENKVWKYPIELEDGREKFSISKHGRRMIEP